jgi:hypothetical protein
MTSWILNDKDTLTGREGVPGRVNDISKVRRYQSSGYLGENVEQLKGLCLGDRWGKKPEIRTEANC